MHFLRGMLYGFGSRERSRYLTARPDSTATDFSGGHIEFTDGAGIEYRFERSARYSAEGGWAEQTLLENGESGIDDPTAISRLLGAIDEATFVRIYAIGLAELQELNLLGDTEAAQLIYRLTSGVDRVSLFDILDEVNQARQHYLSPDGQAGILPELNRKLEAAELRVSELGRRGAHWSRLSNRRKAVGEKLEGFEAEIQQLECQRRTAEAVRRISSEWDQRATIMAHVELLADRVPEAFVIFSEDPLARLKELHDDLAGCHSEIEQIRGKRDALKSEAEKLQVNRSLVQQRSRIDAISELSGWIANLQGQSESCSADITRMQEHLARSYGMEPGESAGTGINITASVITSLRGPARQWQEQKRRVRDARKVLQDTEQEAEIADQAFESALTDSGCLDLPGELEATASRITLLRRFEANQDRLAHLRKTRDGVVAELADPSTAELLSPVAMVGIGGTFILGFMAVVASTVFGGWLGMTPVTRAILGIMGIGPLLGAAGARFLIQRNNLSRLSLQRRQLDLLSRQESECQRENEDLEVNVGSGERARDELLVDCERRMSVLEMIVPLDAARRAAMQKVESTSIRLEHASTSFTAAEERWAEALSQSGLPESLLPRHLRQYASDQKYIAEQVRQLEQRKLELQRCDLELDSLRRRIEQVGADSGIEMPDTDLANMLRELTATLAREISNVARYRSLAKKDRKLRKQIRRTKVVVEELEARRSSMFSQAGCPSEKEFRSQATRHSEFLEFRSQLEEIDKQIDSAIGDNLERREVEIFLAELGDTDASEALLSINKEIERSQQKRDELNQRAGALDAEMVSLEEDKSLAVAQLELSAVTHQHDRASQSWRAWEATRRVLGIVRDDYESHRQPETLQEASRWLRKMTGGRYTRIWTPMGEDALLLDDDSNQVWPLESLSSGTRESVYLSLRLALIEGYRKRGILLPVVLDDVLVNFDAERTGFAITAICEFAEMGHQVLFFTCHDHVNQLFADLGINSRVLKLRPAHPPRLRQLAISGETQEGAMELVEADIAGHDILEQPAKAPEIIQISIADKSQQEIESSPVTVEPPMNNDLDSEGRDAA